MRFIQLTGILRASGISHGYLLLCCSEVRKLVWALSVLSSDDVWLFGRLGDKLAERQEADGDLDLDRPVAATLVSNNM